MNILIICRLKDIQVFRKLEPLTLIDEVETIYLVRREPVDLKKVKCYIPPAILRKTLLTAELYKILIASYLLLFKKVHVVMGIFLIPHGIIAGIFGRLFRKPVIQNIIGKDFHLALKSRWYFRFIKSATIVITRGPLTKKILMEKGVDPGIIYSPPNAFDFKKIPSRTNSKKVYDLIFVGSLENYKRPDILLESLKILKRDFKTDVKLAIVGDGTLMKKMLRLARKYDIYENISFLGKQNNNDVYPLLHQSKVFILTSETEGLPMAMIEAMSCGLPCIVPDVSDVTSVAVHNHNALVVPVGDAEGFADSIYRLLTNETLLKKMSANAGAIRQEREEEYSLENIVSIWRKILSRVLGPT